MDEFVDAFEAPFNKIGASKSSDPEVFKAFRISIANDFFPTFFAQVETRLSQLELPETGLLVGSLSIAELKLVNLVASFESGFFDHIPTDIFSKTGPLFSKLIADSQAAVSAAKINN